MKSVLARLIMCRLIIGIGGILGSIVGLILAYMVHVKWHFFGATFIQLRTIICLWSMLPAVLCVCGCFIGAYFVDRLFGLSH